MGFIQQEQAGEYPWPVLVAYPSEYAQELQPSSEVHEPHPRQLPQGGQERGHADPS